MILPLDDIFLSHKNGCRHRIDDIKTHHQNGSDNFDTEIIKNFNEETAV